MNWLTCLLDRAFCEQVEISGRKLLQVFYGLRSKRSRRSFVRRRPVTPRWRSTGYKLCHFVSMVLELIFEFAWLLICFASVPSPLVPSPLGHHINSGSGFVHPSPSPHRFHKAQATVYPSTIPTSTNASGNQTHLKSVADWTLNLLVWRWLLGSLSVAQKRFLRRSRETPMCLLHRLILSVRHIRPQRKKDRVMVTMFDSVCVTLFRFFGVYILSWRIISIWLFHSCTLMLWWPPRTVITCVPKHRVQFPINLS